MKLKHSSKELNRIRFNGVEKGYDPLEVDQILDEIIDDYKKMDALVHEITNLEHVILLKEQEIRAQNEQVASLLKESEAQKEKYISLQAEYTFQQKRLENLGDGKKISISSLDQLNYIQALETELAKLGGDVEKCRRGIYRHPISVQKKSKIIRSG